MLKPKARSVAVRIASRLIIKMARQIADTGYSSGKLKLVKGWRDAAEMELDRTIENFVDQPEAGILDNVASYVREKEKKAFVIMIDHSYSMRGLKVLLAAVTAATIAQHFKRDYAVVAFSNSVSILKGIAEPIGPEQVLEKLFALILKGDTDVRMVLEAGLQQMKEYNVKKGLLLTDGAWNAGGNPQDMATRFDKLNVICFPPAKPDKVKLLSGWGRGEFAFVEKEEQIANAIIKCLG